MLRRHGENSSELAQIKKKISLKIFYKFFCRRREPIDWNASRSRSHAGPGQRVFETFFTGEDLDKKFLKRTSTMEPLIVDGANTKVRTS